MIGGLREKGGWTCFRLRNHPWGSGHTEPQGISEASRGCCGVGVAKTIDSSLVECVVRAEARFAAVGGEEADGSVKKHGPGEERA